MGKTLTVRISDELRAELEEISRSEHVPMSDLVRESLKRLVAVRQFQELRRKIVPYAEAQGIFTDEDVFEAIK